MVIGGGGEGRIEGPHDWRMEKSETEKRLWKGYGV